MSRLFSRLVLEYPKLAQAFRDFMMGIEAWASVFVGDINLDRFQRWLWSTPQEQVEVLQSDPLVSKEIEALLVVYQQHVGTQHEVMDLRRELLKLPALQEEGY